MRIPTLALTTAAAAALVTLPTAANAAPPVANTDSAQAGFETATVINVLTNDTDSDPGTTLTVTGKTDGANGTVTCTASACTYTPKPNWVGTDSFTYTLSDNGAPGTVTGTVNVQTIHVASVANLVTKPGTTTADSNVKYPEKVDIATVVKDPSGARLSGVQVSLFATPSTGPATAIFSTTTSATGKASISGVQPDTRTSYQWRTPGKNSASWSVGVTPNVSATFEPSRLSVGDETLVTGTSAPAAAGAPIVLQKLNASGTWVTAQSASFTSASTPTVPAAFSFTLPAAASKVTAYRVVVPADHGRGQGESQVVNVRTYQAEILKVVPGSSADQDEYVTVNNTGNVPLKLQNWVLSGGQTPLTLPKREVAPGAFVRIHTGKGKDSLKNLFLDLPRVWNNTEGTVTLTDSNQFSIDEVTYPVVP